ncbi:hypothetical protein D3C72_1632320 [compost metagenome]
MGALAISNGSACISIGPKIVTARMAVSSSTPTTADGLRTNTRRASYDCLAGARDAVAATAARGRAEGAWLMMS